MNQVVLRGQVPGWANLLWSGGDVTASLALQVAVLPVRTVRVAFRYLYAGQQQSTGRIMSLAPRLLAAAGELLQRQANVELVFGGAEAVVVNQNVVATLEFEERNRSSAERWLTGMRARDAHVTVFYVRNLDVIGNNRDEAGIARASTGLIVLEDHQTNPDYVALAHELTHALGFPDHHPTGGSLMSTGGAGNEAGRRLTRDQILTINPLTARRPR